MENNLNEVRDLITIIDNRKTMLEWMDDINKQGLKVMFCFAVDVPGNSNVYSTIPVDQLIHMMKVTLIQMQKNKPIQIIT